MSVTETTRRRDIQAGFVTFGCDASRARPSFGRDVTLSQIKRDVTSNVTVTAGLRPAITVTKPAGREGVQKQGRQQMPATAALVDELRQAFGAERIDAAIAAGQQARREYWARVQADGKASADRWLERKRFPAVCFHAIEGCIEVGIARP